MIEGEMNRQKINIYFTPHLAEDKKVKTRVQSQERF